MPVVDKKCIEASAEYERNSDLIDEDLIRLREWVLTQKHLPEIKDEMLRIFHHSCYYDLTLTKECIETYYTVRSNAPEIFKDRDVRRPELAQALEVTHMAVFPVADPNGYRIIYTGLKDTDSSKFKYVETNKLAFMTIDAWLKKCGPEPGIIIIQDMKGAKLGHLAKFSLSVMRKTFQYQQEGNPIRLVGIHMVNVVPWIDKAMAMVKPFIKKELLSLIHFHKSDMISLYEQLPKECLSSDLGGTLESVEVLHAENIKRLESYCEIFAEEEKFSLVNESKREKKKKTKKQLDADMMFQKLEID